MTERNLFDEVEKAAKKAAKNWVAFTPEGATGPESSVSSSGDLVFEGAWQEDADYAALAANNAHAFVKALRAAEEMAEVFGDYYCGACGNGGDDFDQPYSDVADLDAHTCKHCRPTVELWWETKRLIAAAKRGEVTDG